ncbi:hypothetical protein V6N13_071171 [Hibiscus sabdariffa]
MKLSGKREIDKNLGIAQEKLGIEPKLGIDKKGIEHKKDDEDFGANDNVLINEGLERWTKGKPNALSRNPFREHRHRLPFPPLNGVNCSLLKVTAFDVFFF